MDDFVIYPADEFSKQLEEFKSSDKFDVFVEKIKASREITKSRYCRFDTYLETHDFDKLMYRLFNEHNSEYCEKCYHNGFESYPNNKLRFLIAYIKSRTEPVHVKLLDIGFPNTIWEFRGYYIQNTYGQGTMTEIYNKADLRLLLRLG